MQKTEKPGKSCKLIFDRSHLDVTDDLLLLTHHPLPTSSTAELVSSVPFQAGGDVLTYDLLTTSIDDAVLFHWYSWAATPDRLLIISPPSSLLYHRP